MIFKDDLSHVVKCGPHCRNLHQYIWTGRVFLDHQHVPQESSGGNPYFPSLGLFQHIQEQWKLYKILAWGTGIDVLTRHLQKSLSEKIEQRLSADGQTYELPVPIIANFLSGSFLSLVKWWLDNKLIYSAEQMNEMFLMLTLPGLHKY